MEVAWCPSADGALRRGGVCVHVKQSLTQPQRNVPFLAMVSPDLETVMLSEFSHIEKQICISTI